MDEKMVSGMREKWRRTNGQDDILEAFDRHVKIPYIVMEYANGKAVRGEMMKYFGL